MPTIDFRPKPPTGSGFAPFQESGATFMSWPGRFYVIEKTSAGNGYACQELTKILLQEATARAKLEFITGNVTTISCLDRNGQPIGTAQHFTSSPNVQVATLTTNSTRIVQIDCHNEMDVLVFSWR
jgi:hypothetical protein